jgi:hypothetical protein
MKGDPLKRNLAYIIVGATVLYCLIITIALLWGCGIKETTKDLILIILTWFVSKAGTVYDYFYGTSQSSDKKTDLINEGGYRENPNIDIVPNPFFDPDSPGGVRRNLAAPTSTTPVSEGAVPQDPHGRQADLRHDLQDAGLTGQARKAPGLGQDAGDLPREQVYVGPQPGGTNAAG